MEQNSKPSSVYKMIGRSRRTSGKAPTPPAVMQEPPQPEEDAAALLSLATDGGWAAVCAALHERWSARAPLLLAPNSERPWEATEWRAPLDRAVLSPLVALLAGRADTLSLAAAAGRLGVGAAARPANICGHVFRSGEPTYTCRECACDATCVMCHDCFLHSAHRKHRYRMHTSGGSGFCDCGDVEAWKDAAACSLHRPSETPAVGEARLAADDEQRCREVLKTVLRYAVSLLCWRSETELPDSLRRAETEYPFESVLFNDESHTYENVIRALELAVHCSEEQAMLLATIVDREGRTTVKVGAKELCDRACAEIQRKTAKDENPRTGKKGPLKVVTMDTCLAAHQLCAVQLLVWMSAVAQQIPPLLHVISELLLEESSCEATTESMVVQLLLRDRDLWKAARSAVHQLLMATVFMDSQLKQRFARAFTRLYAELLHAYVDDDHDHGMSVISLTVQMFTVPSVSRVLVAEENALPVVLGALFDHCEAYRKAGRLNFSRLRSNPPPLRRAMMTTADVKYLLNSRPTPAEWTASLRDGFLRGCSVLLNLLDCMQGMDEVRRQTGEHQVWEAEWETAFNVQLRLQQVLTLVQHWALSDATVHYELLNLALAKLHTSLMSPGASFVGGAECDVAKEAVSIHVPLCRLVAGLCGGLAETARWTDYFTEPFDPQRSLAELPLRVVVMDAQAHAGMWRRNGYAILNQIHNYYSPLCRTEMYDKDMLMLQLSCSQSEPDEFVARLLRRFGLKRWAESEYEEQRSADELSRQVVTLAEELLHLLIIIIGERWSPALSEEVQLSDALLREVVHILCKGPSPYSKIEKKIPDDPLLEKISLEETVKTVANFRPPAGTNAGTFELKREYLSMYNPFFYHYSKPDLSLAEQWQQKERKGCEDTALLACAPPPPPLLRDVFAPLVGVLRCDALLHVLALTLERQARRSSVSSDGLLHRALFLIGMALNEQLRADVAFDFTPRADHWRILELLEKLIAGHEADCATHLLTWTVARYKEARRRLRNTPERQPSVESAEMAVAAPADSEDRLREARRLVAADKRKNALEQMARLQRKFIEQNKALLADDGLLDDDDDEMTQVCGSPSDVGFPVALGPFRTAVSDAAPRKVTCILCQESTLIAFSGRAVVCAAFIQQSTFFSKADVRHVPLPDSHDSTFMPADLFFGIHVSTCAHAMHWDCWQQFFEAQAERERRRARAHLILAQRMINTNNDEYQCPLCKRLSNAALPLLPPLHQLFSEGGSEAATGERVQSYDEWLASTLVAASARGSATAGRRRRRRKHRSVPGAAGGGRKRAHSCASDGATADVVLGSVSSGADTEPMDVADSSDSDDEASDASGGEAATAASVTEIASWDELSAEVRGLLRSLPATMLGNVQRLFARHTRSENVPATFVNWEMVRIFEQAIVKRGLGATPGRHEPGLTWQATAYTLRCLDATLSHDNKPLFGAFSTRQHDCLYALTRLAACSHLSKRPTALHSLTSRLLAPLLRDAADLPPISQLDMFTLLVQLCVGVGLLQEGAVVDAPRLPSAGRTESFVLRLTLGAFVFQTLRAWLPDEEATAATASEADRAAVHEAWQLARRCSASWTAADELTDALADALVSDLYDALLSFLRPAALFFHAISLVPPPEALKVTGIDQFLPLCRFLGLPETLGDLLNFVGNAEMWSRWSEREQTDRAAVRQPVQPNVLRELPDDFSDLINKAAQFACPSVQGGSTDEARSPTLCLVCGQLLCSQSYCCQRHLDGKSVGACTYHKRVCSGASGMFMRIRDSQVMLLAGGDRGCFRAAPYVDEFGETDHGFRRGNPLHFSRELFARLQHLWMHHSVAEEVVNQYEIDHRNFAIEWHNL